MTLLPYLEANRIEAGCDEVGRGCLAGPVVAAAVILPVDYHNPWIQDSKKLSKHTREELIQEIKGAALGWAVAEASVADVVPEVVASVVPEVVPPVVGAVVAQLGAVG